MMGKTKIMLPFLIAVLLCVCFLSSLAQGYDSGMAIYSWVIPLICFIISTLYGINNSFNIFYVIIASILIALILFVRVPLVWSFVIYYGITVLIGNIIGMIFYKRNIRIKYLEKHRRIITITTAIAIAGGYIIAVIISAIMMSQMTQITYNATAYGAVIREDTINFEANTAQRIYYDFDGELRGHEDSQIGAADIFKIKSVCSLSLFPLWQKIYYNPYIMDGDQYNIVRAYNNSESVVFGSNAYPLTYRLVMMVIENAVK